MAYNYAISSGTSATTTSSSGPPFSDLIVNTVFGLVAFIIGVVMIWQGRRAWRIWSTARMNGRMVFRARRSDMNIMSANDFVLA